MRTRDVIHPEQGTPALRAAHGRRDAIGAELSLPASLIQSVVQAGESESVTLRLAKPAFSSARSTCREIMSIAGQPE